MLSPRLMQQRIEGLLAAYTRPGSLEGLADIPSYYCRTWFWADMGVVALMFDPMPDLDEEDRGRWFADMRSRGATEFVKKPFRSAGRTLERVIKKMLAGQRDPVRLPDRPPTAAAAQKEPRGAEIPNIIPVGPLPEGLRRIIAAAGDGPGRAVVEPGKAKENEPADRYAAIPNEPIDMDEFMQRFCEARSRENRLCRKRALLAAARHGTVVLPPAAEPHKQGQAKKYFTRDLLAAWQGFLAEGVDLPPLRPEFAAGVTAVRE